VRQIAHQESHYRVAEWWLSAPGLLRSYRARAPSCHLINNTHRARNAHFLISNFSA
jgi:hypothetical protein